MKHSIISDCIALRRHQNVTIDENRGIISTLINGLVGLKAWARIDYLCKHGFVWTRVSSLRGKNYIHYDENDNVVNKSKRAKRENKLNMAAMTKASMRKVKK